jgi:hypothetical protein
MTKTKAIERLKTLYAEIDALTKEHKISAKGEEIFAGDLAESRLLVVADGLGAADLMIVDGNYPVDYYTKHERRFNTEEAACDQADRLLANYNNEDEDEKDKGKDWNDLVEEIFDK